MDNITIRKANLNDMDRVIDFIKINWSARHIFVTHPEVLVYQHVIDESFNYILAEDMNNGKIYGINGFILANRRQNPDIWGALWKTIRSSNVMLGLEIQSYMSAVTKCSMSAGIGLSNQAIKINKLQKKFIGKLNHYYRLADKPDYKVAVVKQKKILPIEKGTAKLVKVENYEDLIKVFDFTTYGSKRPYKDGWYIRHRYFEHPVYKYDLYLIDDGNHRNLNSFLVCREIELNGAKILRIVDFVGVDAELVFIAGELQNLMDLNGYEYVDFYNYGISHDIMLKAGFLLRDEEDTNVIPNYFEPFIQKNIDLHFVTSCINNFYAFKADADQDRPNVL